MKKVLAFVIAAVFMMGLAACQPTTDGENSQAAQNDSSKSSTISSEQGTDTSSKEESSAPDSTSSAPDTSSQTESTSSGSQTPDSETSEPDTESAPSSASGSADKLIAAAKAALGKPFAQGGYQLETGFDNSGLLYYAAKESGLEFPRKVADQVNAGTKVSYEELKPGDFAFFSGDEAGVAQIGGIVTADGVMIISTKPGDDVHEQQITSNYWKTHFVSGVRLG